MLRTILSEFEATGSLSTRWFHGLFAGNTAQPPTRAGLDPAPSATVAPATTATAPVMAVHRLIPITGGDGSAGDARSLAPPEESDQMPEEGQPGTPPDDPGAGKSDEGGEKSAGNPGEEAQDGDEQATGNPKNAG